MEDAEVKEIEYEIPASATPGSLLEVPVPDGKIIIKVTSGLVPGTRIILRCTDGKWGITQIRKLEIHSKVLAPSLDAWQGSEAYEAELEQHNVCKVVIETSKGPIKLRIVPGWAPKGCQRFLQLVMDQFFMDLAIYRAVPGSLIAFGILHQVDWRYSKYQAIEDDQLRGVPIEEGMVCFCAAGPGARSTAICIFLGKFETLGRNQWETPIGKVCPESLAVLRSIHTGYGEMPQCGGSGPDPIRLEESGNSYIRENFPLCDFVKSAAWMSGGTPQSGSVVGSP